MNQHLIQMLFPNASKSLIAANAEDSELRLENEERDQDPSDHSKLERDIRNGALGTTKTKAGDSRRFLVRIKSIRRRLLDEDNLCEKYAIDCCRYAGLLPGDSPGQTKIEISQRKAGKEEQEHTLIEIYEAT